LQELRVQIVERKFLLAYYRRKKKKKS